MAKNTAVTFLYRDADNYKESRDIVVEGEMTERLKTAITGTYVDNEFVDLGKTTFQSLEGLFPDKVIDDEVDHNFVTLEFSETTEAADMTQREFSGIFGVDWATELEFTKSTAPSPGM